MNSGAIAPILVFDVNETLLDLKTLEPLFLRLFGNADILREWFPELVLYSQTLTLSDRYVPFGEIAVAVFHMVADNHGVAVTEQDAGELRQRLLNMPACGDVIPAMQRLRDAGFRLVTLTNSPPAPSPTPLEKAGISDYLEAQFSVDAVRRFKPHASVYQHVAAQLQVETRELCMVACHVWDIIGAQAVGCQGAMITRAHNSCLPLSALPAPDFVAPDIGLLADQLIQADT